MSIEYAIGRDLLLARHEDTFRLAVITERVPCANGEAEMLSAAIFSSDSPAYRSVASLWSACALIPARDDEGLLRLLPLEGLGIDLPIFVRDGADLPAGEASEPDAGLKVGPGYLQLMAAIQRNVSKFLVFHEWPILSVGCGDSTVAELSAAFNGGGQGGRA